MVTEKSREARVRAKADRCGYRLEKSRRRDPDAIDYGLYALIDVKYNAIVNPQLVNSPYAWDLDDVEDWLRECG